MELVNILKALADENRIRIINILINHESCVCEIETILNLNQANVSRHLAKLKANGIITSTKEAQWVHYSISSDFIKNEVEIITFLSKKFITIDTCVKDINRLNKYNKCGLTCTDIRKDMQKVKEFLEDTTDEQNNVICCYSSCNGAF